MVSWIVQRINKFWCMFLLNSKKSIWSVFTRKKTHIRFFRWVLKGSMWTIVQSLTMMSWICLWKAYHWLIILIILKHCESNNTKREGSYISRKSSVERKDGSKSIWWIWTSYCSITRSKEPVPSLVNLRIKSLINSSRLVWKVYNLSSWWNTCLGYKTICSVS